MTTFSTRSSLVRALFAVLLTTCASLAVAAATVGTAAPDFTLRTLSGPNMRLQEHRGQVVLVNFWATWCGPCRKEMPHLNRIADKYRSSGLVMLGVNVDDDVRNAADVATKLGVKFPVLLDTDKKVSRLYDLNSMPSTLVIDRSGRVRFLHRGYQDGYEDQYDKQIRDLLKE
ncbi:MAG: TlpA family protein disulfide reductase [Cytophagales bacterium]|nr:TlpA family protein disulfide reductase [Rhizobacter sp.]